VLILALKCVINAQAGAADKELPAISATCEKKGLRPWGWEEGRCRLRREVLSIPRAPGRTEVPPCLSFPEGGELVSFRGLILVKSTEEGLEMIISKTNK